MPPNSCSTYYDGLDCYTLVCQIGRNDFAHFDQEKENITPGIQDLSTITPTILLAPTSIINAAATFPLHLLKDVSSEGKAFNMESITDQYNKFSDSHSGFLDISDFYNSEDRSIFTPYSPTFPVPALAPIPTPKSSSPDTLGNYSPQPMMSNYQHVVGE